MKTVILGATDKKHRAAYRAAELLEKSGNEWIPIGIRPSTLLDRSILDLKERPLIEDVHTVTLYIGAENQPEWYDYIISLKPKRLIFNPGTENTELWRMAKDKGIEVENACTLVLLSIGRY